jgi:hypothetical protein
MGRQHPGHASNTEMKDSSDEKPAPIGQKISTEEHSRLIQARAYSLWEQAGKPSGDAARERFWCEAEKNVMASQASDE